MELLGYGSHITVEGFQASETSLADNELVKAVVQDLASMLEPRSMRQASAELSAENGSSAAEHRGETQISLHTFVSARAWQMRLFTRRDFPVTEVFGLLRERFGTGRFESRLTAVGKVAPVDNAGLARILAGDRGYAWARLETEDAF